MKDKFLQKMYLGLILLGLIVLAYNSRSSFQAAPEAPVPAVIKPEPIKVQQSDQSRSKMYGIADKETALSCSRFKIENVQDKLDGLFMKCVDKCLSDNDCAQTAGSQCRSMISDVEAEVKDALALCSTKVALAK